MRTVAPRTWTRRLLTLGFAVGGFALTATAIRSQEAAPTPRPVQPTQPQQTNSEVPADSQQAADYASRPVAYIYGNIAVTRQDLGEFLIARGGAEKLELLVNKKIIEAECQKRGITVTDKELEAALLEDLEGLSIKKADFVKVVLPRYGKTLYEWMEDVVRPRLLLTKMARDRVKVEEADLKVQFEREYGEKRQVQMIMWPPNDDLKSIQATWEKIRGSQQEFDSVARSQSNPAIASAAGHIKPISRHLPAADRIVEDVAFGMKEGEVSQILKTTQGYMVMKLHRVIPAATTVNFEEMKPRLEKQAFEEKMAMEIPKFFEQLKKTANPVLYFEGPTAWRTEPTGLPTSGNVMNGVIPASNTAPAQK